MDIPIDIKTLGAIKRMIVNPTVKVTMLLPEKVFVDFKFDKYIYLKHKDFQGYFFVEKIENYKNGTTPVTVYLLMVDPKGYIFSTQGDVMPDEQDYLLLETSDFMLLETGDQIILE